LSSKAVLIWHCRDEKAVPDQTLIKLLDQAHGWVEKLKDGVSLKVIAAQKKVTPAYIRTRSKLAFLSPKVQKAILDGALDPAYTANRLVRMKIPLDWREQESLFLNSWSLFRPISFPDLVKWIPCF